MFFRSTPIQRPLIGLLLLASFGCQPSRSDPSEVNSTQEKNVAGQCQVDPTLLLRRGPIQFIAHSAAGQQLAKQKNLPCLLFFTAEWCNFCQQMKATAFSDDSVDQLAQHFVCVLVDADREAEICRQYSIDGFPTVQFLAADGRRLHRLVGRQSSSALAAGMQAALLRLAWIENTERQRR